MLACFSIYWIVMSFSKNTSTVRSGYRSGGTDSNQRHNFLQNHELESTARKTIRTAVHV